MQLFLGVMTKDTRVRSTNHPTSKLLERVVEILMEMVKERIVETTYHTKILGMLRQDFSTAYNTKGSDKKWKQFSILQLNRFGNGEKIL